MLAQRRMNVQPQRPEEGDPLLSDRGGGWVGSETVLVDFDQWAVEEGGDRRQRRSQAVVRVYYRCCYSVVVVVVVVVVVIVVVVEVGDPCRLCDAIRWKRKARADDVRFPRGALKSRSSFENTTARTSRGTPSHL